MSAISPSTPPSRSTFFLPARRHPQPEGALRSSAAHAHSSPATGNTGRVRRIRPKRAHPGRADAPLCRRAAPRPSPRRGQADGPAIPPPNFGPGPARPPALGGHGRADLSDGRQSVLRGVVRAAAVRDAGGSAVGPQDASRAVRRGGLQAENVQQQEGARGQQGRQHRAAAQRQQRAQQSRHGARQRVPAAQHGGAVTAVPGPWPLSSERGRRQRRRPASARRPIAACRSPAFDQPARGSRRAGQSPHGAGPRVPRGKAGGWRHGGSGWREPAALARKGCGSCAWREDSSDPASRRLGVPHALSPGAATSASRLTREVTRLRPAPGRCRVDVRQRPAALRRQALTRLSATVCLTARRQAARARRDAARPLRTPHTDPIPPRTTQLRPSAAPPAAVHAGARSCSVVPGLGGCRAARPTPVPGASPLLGPSAGRGGAARVGLRAARLGAVPRAP